MAHIQLWDRSTKESKPEVPGAGVGVLRIWHCCISKTLVFVVSMHVEATVPTRVGFIRRSHNSVFNEKLLCLLLRLERESLIRKRCRATCLCLFRLSVFSNWHSPHSGIAQLQFLFESCIPYTVRPCGLDRFDLNLSRLLNLPMRPCWPCWCCNWPMLQLLLSSIPLKPHSVERR